MQSLNVQTIGTISSPFTEKFGIPRQPGLAPSITAEVRLEPEYSRMDAVTGLEDCSHIWLLFIFSKAVRDGWKPRVRPPRLGGNRKLGVFATRAPFRPNPIGLSAVELLSIEMRGKQLVLTVRGADLLDGTPIIDIKPYLPYSDSLPEAHFDIADSVKRLDLPVIFSDEAQQELETVRPRYPEALEQQIIELLACDPRPAYQNDHTRVYGVRLYDLNIRFSITETEITVVSIKHETVDWSAEDQNT